MDYNLTTPTGWQCPICRYVYNMGVVGCLNCNRPDHEKTTITTSSTTITPTPQFICKSTISNTGKLLNCTCGKCEPREV